MKTLKRLLPLLLAVALVLAFGACKKTEEPAPTSSADVTDPATTQPGDADPTPSADPVIDPSADPTDTPSDTKGTLIMATNAAFPPYEYYEGGEIVGIDAEIAAAIAEKLNMELKIEDMEFDSIITAVNGGKADMGMAGMTVTGERLEAVNFTNSYATGVQVVIVTEDSAITSVDDLFAEGASHVIGVQRNTTGDIYTTGDLEDKGLATIDRYSKGSDAVMALKTGKVDCVVIDNQPAKAFVAENEGLKILETEYAVEDYAIAIAKNNTDLLEQVNTALEELIADGTVQAILDKYIA